MRTYWAYIKLNPRSIQLKLIDHGKEPVGYDYLCNLQAPDYNGAVACFRARLGLWHDPEQTDTKPPTTASLKWPEWMTGDQLK